MTTGKPIRFMKSFGRAHALDGLDLRVGEGEVHGFLGPNGAGKSTSWRTLMGLTRAERGLVRALGRDPWHDAVWCTPNSRRSPVTSLAGRSPRVARRSPATTFAATCSTHSERSIRSESHQPAVGA